MFCHPYHEGVAMRYGWYSMVPVLLLTGECGMVCSLDMYRARRDFQYTDEPPGKKVSKTKRSIFVIQQHAARAMHYDTRLSIDGVLVSWTVPKGPSIDPKVKRLAVMTEDHPLEYATFEGIIPRGQYGAGPVIVWDRGTYKNIREKDGKPVSMKQCLKDGRIEIFLRGKKLEGGFALIRTGSAADQKSRWLLIKMKDEYADARRNPVASEPESVKTGVTIQELKKKIAAMEKRQEK